MDDSIALMFNNTLQKIYSQCSRKSTHLRECCKIAQDTIRDSPLFTKSTEKHDNKEYEILGNKLFIAMKLACETKEPKIMTIALDCLDKMMSYGIIKSTINDETSGIMNNINNSLANAGNNNNINNNNSNSNNTGGEKKKLIESVVELIGSYFSFQDENVQLQIIKALLTSVLTPSCDVHDTCLMNSIKTSYNIYLVSTSKTVNCAAAKSALFQMVDCVLQKFELVSQQKMHPSSTNSSSSSTTILSNSNEEINTSYQSNLSDVILLFRAFCKLSTKDIPDGLQADSHEMKSKLLSLELLSRILENPLPSLKLSEKFINSSIKRYLSNSLLINGTNQHLPVFKLTLTLFLSLIIHFKEYLKEEIGLFFSKILLNVLSSPQCSAKQKWLILPVLYEICKNPQTIVDIFVNYDCDPDRKDIFEKMVYELSRVAQGTISGDQRTTSLDDMKFKTLGLECIVTIMKSLVDWSKELYESTSPSTSTTTTPKKKSSSSNSSVVLPPVEEKDLSKLTLLEQGIYKFNQSSKRGIEFLIKSKVVKETPEDIAQFIKSNTTTLEPKKVGEYLVLQNSFNFSVLFKYVELFNFKGIPIDESLRSLLFGFLLHGENQCIDKIIEKFAEKYYADNNSGSGNGSFSNAESVYLLSYAIIILSTDLHNPSIVSKLTKLEWIKMNSKINNRNDFEESFLNGIYDRLLMEPFKIINDDLALNSQDKLLRFNRESDYIAKQCQELIKAKLSKKSIFYKARNIEHVRPMFLLSWCYVLSTLSVVLDDTKDKKVIQLCLEGFSYAIRVSCIFYMNVERSSFITSLSKFSLLDSIKEPSLKNIECVKTLLSIGISEGNYLQDSWTPILKAICILERFQLFNSTKNNQVNINNGSEDNDEITLINSPSIGNGSSPTIVSNILNSISSPNLLYNNIENQIRKLIEDNPKELSFDSSQIERIFTNTTNLSDDSIVTFFRCLCEVSDDEIAHYSRNYSLIKLVEIIEYNFKRIRLVFYNIWEIVVQHFTKVGCNSNIEIAQHSIDSLRQLANKYLEKQELTHYNFQNEFLVPFQDIMKINPSPLIKELIIRCVVQLSILKAKNIKSGWKTIINVLTLGSKVLNESIVQLSFQGIDQLIKQNFQLVQENFFLNIINCCSSFCQPSVPFYQISIKSLELLLLLSQHVTGGSGDESIDKLLLPIIQGTSMAIIHENEQVRKLACALLFDLLNQKGSLFNDDHWNRVLVGIITPIFQSFDLSKLNNEHTNNWLKQTFPVLLNYTIELLLKFNVQLNKYFNSFLVILEPFICCWSELSCQISIDYYALFIIKCSPYFNDEFYCQSLIDSINRILKKLLISKLSPPPISQSSTLSNNSVNSPTVSNSSIGSVGGSNIVNGSSPLISAITPETPKKSSNVSGVTSPINKSFSRTLLSLKPFTITEEESSFIGKKIKSNSIKYEKTEPFLSIHNWNTAIKFQSAINKVYTELQCKIPIKFGVLLAKNWDIVFILSQRINSEIIFISHFGETNTQNYECSTLSLYLSLLFEMFLSDEKKRSKEVEDILSRFTLGILKENSLTIINNSNGNSNGTTSTTSPTTSSTTSSSNVSNVSSTRIFNSSRMIGIICQIIQGYTRYSVEQFKKHQIEFFSYCIDLSLHDNQDIRNSLSKLFARCKVDLPVVKLHQCAPTTLRLDPAPTIGQKNNSQQHQLHHQQQQLQQQKQDQENSTHYHVSDQVLIIEDNSNIITSPIISEIVRQQQEQQEIIELVKQVENVELENNDEVEVEVEEEEVVVAEEEKGEEVFVEKEEEEIIAEEEEVEVEVETKINIEVEAEIEQVEEDLENSNNTNNTNNNNADEDFTSIESSNDIDGGFVNINDK